MTLQSTGYLVSDPAGGAEIIDLPMADVIPHIKTGLPAADPGNGVLGRIAFGGGTPAQMGVYTPATVGGLDFYYGARHQHSSIGRRLDNSDTNIWFHEVVSVPAASEVVLPHTLEGVPDFLIVGQQSGTVKQGIDWAITEVAATQFKIRNWDALEDAFFLIQAWLVHSIQNPLETIQAPPVAVLNGAAVVPVPHGLGRVPDFISVFPYELGGVQPSGLPIMDSPPDEVNIYLRNVAAGALNAKVYAQATHSIQL